MNELTTPTAAATPAPIFSTTAAIMSPEIMGSISRFAEFMSKSTVTVPDHLRGKPSDCMAITLQAMRWGMDPFAVAQKTHLVSGRLGYEAQLVIAAVQNSGAIEGAFRYQFDGEGQNLRCRVGAKLAGDADITWGPWLRNGDVTTRNSPLWKVNPAQQLGYLQAKNWARLYCPGAILGVYSADELEVIERPPVDMGRADVVEPEKAPVLPDYPAADFEKNLPEWQRKLIDTGKKTAPELLAMLSTKATFSESQKARILSLRAAEPADVVDMDEEPASIGDDDTPPF